MRIFLTGGTGYVGSAVLDALVRGGHHVDALVRTTDAAADVQRRGTHPILGDILQPATWRDSAAAADAIVHAAAEDGPRVRTVDEAALNVVAELPPRDGRVVVYTSGIWVLGAAPAPVDESAPTNAIEHVAWRPAHEERVLNGGVSGARAIVVRPGILYGGHRGIVGDLFRDALNGLVRVIGGGENHWPLVYHRDVGDLYLRLITTETASGVFHATDGGEESVNEIVSALGEHLPITPTVRHVPLPEARKKMGTYAEALALDQRVLSRRSRELGWMPALHSVSGNISRLLAEWRMEEKQ